MIAISPGLSRLPMLLVLRSTRATATMPGGSAALPGNGSGILTDGTFIGSILPERPRRDGQVADTACHRFRTFRHDGAAPVGGVRAATPVSEAAGANSAGAPGRHVGEHRVADADRAAGQDVRADAAAVDEVLDDPGTGELLQVQARLAGFDAEALHLADPEALADQVVEPHPADDDLPPGLRPGQADLRQDLGLDQGQRRPRPGLGMAVALQPLAGDRADRADRAERVAGTDVDGLDMHAIYGPR